MTARAWSHSYGSTSKQRIVDDVGARSVGSAAVQPAVGRKVGAMTVPGIGMSVEWDVPIAMDDGVVLRANVFRPDDDAAASGGVELRPLRQGSGVSGGLPRRVGGDGAEPSGGGRGFVEPLPVVGGVRSGEMGAGRICMRTGRRPRVGPLTGPHRSVEHPRDDRPARLHRVGGHPAVEHRKSRPARHQLLRRQPMAGRRVEPPASGGDDPLGRLFGFLPRALLSRRHRMRHEVGLVPAHRHHGAARPRGARLRQRQHRRARRGARDAHLCRSGSPQIRFSR